MEDKCSGVALEPGQDCHLRVAFAPSSEGTKQAVLLIPSDDQDDDAREVPLSGLASGALPDGGTGGAGGSGGGGGAGTAGGPGAAGEDDSGCSCRAAGAGDGRLGWIGIALMSWLLGWRSGRNRD